MSLLVLLLSIVIWGIIFWILWWALGAINPPEPWHKVATVILVLATVIVLIGLLTGQIEPFPILHLK